MVFCCADFEWLYHFGIGGLPKDDAQAVSWFEKSADRGDSESMMFLGVAYRDGYLACRRTTPRRACGFANRQI
jgi:TPR repeat protein